LEEGEKIGKTTYKVANYSYFLANIIFVPFNP